MPMLNTVASHRLGDGPRAARGSGLANGTSPLVATAFVTDLGWMAIAGREDVLAGLVFGHASHQRAVGALARYVGPVDFADSLPWMDDLVTRLERYAGGEPVDFGRVGLDLDHLTPFARRVVAACRKIPRGRVRTYGELAAACGSPAAARAVGSVMAKNRFPLIVPCHRVVGAGGGLGGYSAPDGLRMKRRLLAMEGHD